MRKSMTWQLDHVQLYHRIDNVSLFAGSFYGSPYYNALHHKNRKTGVRYLSQFFLILRFFFFQYKFFLGVT